MTDEKSKLKMVIYYIVQRLGMRLTKTKLVKLLFLSDYVAKHGAKHGIGHTITGTTYVYYNHGPFSFDIYPAIDDMKGQEIMEVDISELSKHHSLFSYVEGPMPRFDVKLDRKEKEILDFVIDSFGHMSLNDILSSVYSMKIMKKSDPGDILLE